MLDNRVYMTDKTQLNEDEKKIVDALENNGLINTNNKLYWMIWLAIDKYSTYAKKLKKLEE